MNPVLIFLIALVVLGLFFFVGEWNSEEERSAGIRQRFVLNLATVLLGLLGLVLWWINMLVRRKVLPEEHRKSPE
jgi:drug/metabolite transporter (DMT)-like permease